MKIKSVVIGGSLLLSAIVLIGLSRLAWAGPKVLVGRKHGTERLVPLAEIDHRPWDRLLKRHVDDDGLVDYAAWKSSAADRAALDGYLDQLGLGDPAAETTVAGRLAFWINAYNAVTVRGILREYPTSSIRNHTSRVGGYNLWHDLLLWVGNRRYSLDAMEHKILRPLGEPRIHFAIVCALIGCPRLRNEAFTTERIEQQLADNTRDFFSRTKHFRVDLDGGRVSVSPILKWFEEDFGPTAQSGLAGLADYMPNEPVRRLIEPADFSVDYLEYDWKLNDRGPRAR